MNFAVYLDLEHAQESHFMYLTTKEFYQMHS